MTSRTVKPNWTKTFYIHKAMPEAQDRANLIAQLPPHMHGWASRLTVKGLEMEVAQYKINHAEEIKAAELAIKKANELALVKKLADEKNQEEFAENIKEIKIIEAKKLEKEKMKKNYGAFGALAADDDSETSEPDLEKSDSDIDSESQQPVKMSKAQAKRWRKRMLEKAAKASMPTDSTTTSA